MTEAQTFSGHDYQFTDRRLRNRRDPEAFEVGTMDFDDPDNTGDPYTALIHPFVLDDLELIDILKDKAVHTVHDETVFKKSTMTMEQAAAYSAAFNATITVTGHGIIHKESKA